MGGEIFTVEKTYRAIELPTRSVELANSCHRGTE
jgi:hypothetical protein